MKQFFLLQALWCFSTKGSLYSYLLLRACVHFKEKLACSLKFSILAGIPYQQRSITLKCIIQCFPLCNIVWHRNETPIPILTERTLSNGATEAQGSLNSYSKFVIKTEQKGPSVSENVLEHVESKLTIVSTAQLSFFEKTSHWKGLLKELLAFHIRRTM